ncbi:MAG: ParB/RepB/Spo0J family partition protein [Candidatus Omnitrophica bacterium]|nr:ParB/RepB/Spo0J family partition protein [Candidatus Omnitrophota bacterium]
MERRLGKGLAQIIESSGPAAQQVVMIRTEQIRPSRYQPREDIKPEELEELKASIKHLGIIQPIIVRPIAHGIYELVAGERRWRAAQAIGVQEVPSIIKALTDQQTVEYSLIENLQREDLNPIEEASAFARLVQEFGYTQEQLAESIGCDRTTVTNTLRLLKLPLDMQEALRGGKLSEGHAKVLLGVEHPAKQTELFRQSVAQGWSVRQLETEAMQWQPRSRRRRRELDPEMKAIEADLRQLFGTKVALSPRKRGGRIVIEYFSSEELTRILRVLGVTA